MSEPQRPIIVRGTEILSSDPPRIRLQKLARITLDSMVQFVGLLDAKGNVLEINKVALDAVGITLAQVEGKPFWTTFWWQVSEEVNRILRESIQRAAQGEFVRWDAEIFGRAGGKETIIIDASLCPVKDDDGNVVFICAEGRDITEKKAQEREIAQKNIELQGLLERIRELDQIKTQFFANVSHELRTPLALILGPAQRLIDDNGAMDLLSRRESAQVVARNARMLLKHVNDLLDMSKLEAKKLRIDLQDTDVSALVRFLASHFAVLAAERKIEYVVDADEACVAAVDPDKLQRVLMNLLGNAFKFTGGRVRCSLRQTQEIMISVDDSGPGVKPELRQAIFERFRQGDGGVNRRVGGTGLGLAIAKEFVEMHKGRIEVLDSDLGGARFQITIPLRHVTSQVLADANIDRSLLDGLIEELRPGVEHRPSQVSSGRPRVLVVEDNPDMNCFITQCLARSYEVISAFDGREGLEKALRLHPSLVLSDIMMPNMSGDEMIAEIRKVPELHSTPILLLSAKADEEMMVRLLDQGAQDFIVKPFSEKDLAVRVSNLILAQQARNEAILSLDREHKAREETELQKRLLHSVLMQAPLLIAVLRGPDHVIELANPPMCEQIWKRQQSELVNRPLFEVIPELRYQIVQPRLQEIYQTGIPYIGKETPVNFERSDGVETLYFNFIYSAIRNIDGQVEGIFVVASDVTAQVLAREQVDGLRKTAELANRAKDDFIALLAHELRNPLAPIRNGLQVMRLADGDVTARAETREMMDRQLTHMVRLIDDLLDVSRISRNKMELRRGRVLLSDIVNTAVETVRPLIAAAEHEFSISLPGEPIYLDADLTRLAQVLGNLLNNSAKYTPHAGGIWLSAQRNGGEVVINVRDNGIGIPAGSLGKIFEMFSQVDRSIERNTGGLGIGLALVKGLVEMHGGTVTATSAGEGQGSTFTVTLPVQNRPPAGSMTGNAQAAKGPARRVLVVDDHRDGADSLAMMLRLLGDEVRTAYDGIEAVEVASTFKPEVILMDVGMPRLSGLDATRRIREQQWGREVKVIALTGWGQNGDREKSREAGCDGHLVKPVNLPDLERLLRDLD
jgi:PAS domain S-box-containing protein